MKRVNPCSLFVVITAFLLLARYTGEAQCRTISFSEGIERHLLSDALFITGLDNTYFACPQYFSGDSTQCGTIRHANGDWDAPLPDAPLFSLFFHARQYRLCKPIFQDPFFAGTLKKVPYPDSAAMQWQNYQKNFQTIILPMREEDDQPMDSLDEIQLKMITVLHHVSNWTYCPENKSVGIGTLFGEYKPASRDIVIYKRACRAANVHDFDISQAALVFRLFFVCAHELGHVADDKAGFLSNPTSASRKLAEKRANVNGLILTLAFSQLILQMLRDYEVAIEQTPQLAPCDLIFIRRTIKKWADVSVYFRKRIDDAKLLISNPALLVSTKEQDAWNIFACLGQYNK